MRAHFVLIGVSVAGLALAAGTACDPVGTAAVSIRPIYGWQDGCTAVEISGHGFGPTVEASLAGTPLVDITMPDDSTRLGALDVGYVFNAVTPAGAQSGYADLVVTTNGVTTTIEQAYWYEACPAGAYPETIDITEGLTAGAVVSVSGCNLKSDYVVKIGDADPVPFTSVCGSASVTFTVPDLADGTYPMVIQDGQGNNLYPADPAACEAADTGDTAPPDYCSACPCLTYGGA